MSIQIRRIDPTEAETFYRRFKQRGEQVSFSKTGIFYLAEKDGEAAGLVSASTVGKAVRIKTLIVRPGFRRAGIGTAMLEFLVYEGNSYTAFATAFSRPLFKKFGFVEVSKKANDISYMKREPK